jgi:NTP pyrophosphatase (non-canonical NTP hydrolase)
MNALERGRELMAEFGLGKDPASRALDLSSEVGEVCEEILEGTNYGLQDFRATTKLEIELGDACFSLLALAASVELDLELALEKSVQKMRDRLQRDGQIGSKR